jgi:hypothetical protein
MAPAATNATSSGFTGVPLGRNFNTHGPLAQTLADETGQAADYSLVALSRIALIQTPLRQERAMKRLHVHVAVEDLAQSTRFYSTLLAAEPAVVKDD